MQIGIFETDHFEGAYPVIKLFDDGRNHITIFTNENSFRQFQFLFGESIARYTWIIKNPSESKYVFIYKIYQIAYKKGFDILYLNTISDNHIIYAAMIAALPSHTRIINTLHDINGYFSFAPAHSVRRWVRYIGKRCLIKSVKEFNVVSSTMVIYLKEKLPQQKKVHCVPGCVFENANTPPVPRKPTKPIRLVVPGSIDRRRRDYDFVFDLLDQINNKDIDAIIVLLGGTNRMYGNAIIRKCKEYTSKNSNLEFFENDIVDQPIFDREMDNADFILMPSVIDTVVSDGVTETYGLSITSGNIFDVIKHAKPFIIPERLRIPDDLETSCFKYSTAEDIILLLSTLLNRPEELLLWNEKAFRNSQQYTISNVRLRNPSLFAATN